MIQAILEYSSIMFFIYYLVVSYLLITYIVKSNSLLSKLRLRVEEDEQHLLIALCLKHALELPRVLFVYLIESFDAYYKAYFVAYYGISIDKAAAPFLHTFREYDLVFNNAKM